MKNFTLMIIGVLTLLGAKEANARTLSCSQFRYTNILTIDIDLDSRNFEVAVRAPNRNLGNGKIGRIQKNGKLITIPLYEESALVGSLSVIPNGDRDSIGKSTLDYKGRILTGFEGLFCHFSEQ